MWGLLFGARPSDVRVSASGGSVRLSKSNLLITLAPYFFPFYTFVVIVVAGNHLNEIRILLKPKLILLQESNLTLFAVNCLL